MGLEQDLARLEEIGDELKGEFNFPRFEEAYKAYWQLVLARDIEFSERNIKFTTQERLARLLKEKEKSEFERLRSLLPARLRSKFSAQFLRKLRDEDPIYRTTKLFSINEVVTGFYAEIKEVCYISERLPIELETEAEQQTIVIAHELAHRELHLTRKNNGLIKEKPGGDREEAFCRRLEISFASYLFPIGRHSHKGDVTSAIEELRPIFDQLTEPFMVKSYTRRMIKSYERTLRQHK